MGKAILGTYATPRSVALLDEVRALRQRVAELEAALAEVRAAARETDLDTEILELDAREPVAAG